MQDGPEDGQHTYIDTNTWIHGCTVGTLEHTCGCVDPLQTLCGPSAGAVWTLRESPAASIDSMAPNSVLPHCCSHPKAVLPHCEGSGGAFPKAVVLHSGVPLADCLPEGTDGMPISVVLF